MSGYKFSEAIQEKVRQRANYLCEYCHACERWQYVRFTITLCDRPFNSPQFLCKGDRIIPLKVPFFKGD